MARSIDGGMHKKLIALPLLLLSLLALQACSGESSSTPDYDYADIALYEMEMSETGLKRSAPVRELFISCRSGLAEQSKDCVALGELLDAEVKENGQKVRLLSGQDDCQANKDRNRRMFIDGQIDGQQVYSMIELECAPERQAAFQELFPGLFAEPQADRAAKPSGSCGGMDMSSGKADTDCIQVSSSGFR
jgi:hypothetical protein